MPSVRSDPSLEATSPNRRTFCKRGASEIGKGGCDVIGTFSSLSRWVSSSSFRLPFDSSLSLSPHKVTSQINHNFRRVYCCLPSSPVHMGSSAKMSSNSATARVDHLGIPEEFRIRGEMKKRTFIKLHRLKLSSLNSTILYDYPMVTMPQHPPTVSPARSFQSSTNGSSGTMG